MNACQTHDDSVTPLVDRETIPDFYGPTWLDHQLTTYKPGSGWLLLVPALEYAILLVPELDALRTFYRLTRKGYSVRIHPDPLQGFL